MIYPESFHDRLKFIFWTFYTPYHPFFRDTFIKLGIISHDIRQPFLLGKLSPNRTVEDFVKFLIGQGYGNHFIAWKDKGEIVSLRNVKSFAMQYHIRIFEDGEIRGHYEYTPECHPVWHMKEIGMEDRSSEFKNFLKDWLTE
jgi:hypothetical protein